jgi:hypothetical protein
VFDIVQLSLTDAYRPVTSGAFTLTENYTLTVEAFEAYLDRLDENGVLVITRWLQNPPSEELRTLGIIIAALEARGGNPARQIVAFRTFQTVTFLVKAAPFAPDEMAHVLSEAERLRYDMVLAPDLPPETIKRYAARRADLLPDIYRTAQYGRPVLRPVRFCRSPPTDDHPFFSTFSNGGRHRIF